MTAVEWLEGVRKRDYAIKHMLDERQRLYDIAEKITAGDNDAMPHGSGTSDRVGVCVAQIADLGDDIACKMSEYMAYRHDVGTKLYEWLPAMEYEILYLRYMQFKTWSSIATEINYSEAQVHRIKANGLDIIEKMMANDMV